MALTFNLPSQIVVQTAAQWAVDATVYSNKRILVISDAYYGSTDQRKFKIADGTQTWAQLDYFPVSGYDDATSSIQTQLNAKLTGANITQTITNGVTDKAPSEDAVYDALALKLAKCHTLTLGHTVLGSGVASAVYYFGAPQLTALTTVSASRRLPSAITGYVYTVSVRTTIQISVSGSTQQSSLKIYNANVGTSVTVGATIQYDTIGQSYVYTLGTPFAVTAGDDLYCEITMPAWSGAAPSGIVHYIDALIYGF